MFEANIVGKQQMLENLIGGMSITEVAETHWRNSSHFISNKGNLVICSSNDNESKNGVAIIAVSDRIVSVKIGATPMNLNIIQVYTPTSTLTEKELDTFYGELTVNKVPKREIMIVMGDFNAKIGNIKNDNDLSTVVGRWGIGDRNERGEKLADFCAENGLFISNSGFQHHVRRLYTWLSPDGRTKNQIDYVLIRNRWKTSIKDVKTYLGMKW